MPSTKPPNSHLIFNFPGGVHYKLEVLDLSHNSLASVRNLHLDGLTALKELVLAHNHLISLPAHAFPASVTLTSLDLRSNRILNLHATTFKGLESLEELYLSRNRLSSFPKDVFQGLGAVSYLEINKNKLVEVAGLTFMGLENVKVFTSYVRSS